ncbi:MAG: hypothetical protein PHO10_00675 [Gemmiger sp.]|nr:hypothetical protein [Gemmiger sp.]
MKQKHYIQHNGKRVAALLLSLCLLLGGCAGQRGAVATGESAAPTATAPAGPVATEPQTLAVYYEQENTAAARALAAYAEACNITLTEAETPAQAGLAVLAGAPDAGADYRDLGTDALTAAAARRAGLEPAGCTALPLGRTLYAYWADSTLLGALLGEGYQLADLQNATWEEWSAFVEALGAWLQSPAATTVTLNGVNYTLPAERVAGTENLNGVFALATGADAFTGAAYSSALVAADWQLTDAALAGPLNGLLACFALETEHLAGPEGGLARGAELPALSTAEATALLAGGQALFYRGRLTDALLNLPADASARLVPIPQKCNLTDEDVTSAEYNVTGLLNYPVLVTAGRLAIPAAAEDAAANAGLGFILWLYGSGNGTTQLTENLGLITPWNTASNTTALGALQVAQVSTGVVPGAELSAGGVQGTAAAMAPLLALTKWKNTDRADFILAAEQALGVAMP